MATGLDVVQKSVSGSPGCTDSWVEGQGTGRGAGGFLPIPICPTPSFHFQGSALGFFGPRHPHKPLIQLTFQTFC